MRRGGDLSDLGLLHLSNSVGWRREIRYEKKSNTSFVDNCAG